MMLCNKMYMNIYIDISVISRYLRSVYVCIDIYVIQFCTTVYPFDYYQFIETLANWFWFSIQLFMLQ